MPFLVEGAAHTKLRTATFLVCCTVGNQCSNSTKTLLSSVILLSSSSKSGCNLSQLNAALDLILLRPTETYAGNPQHCFVMDDKRSSRARLCSAFGLSVGLRACVFSIVRASPLTPSNKINLSTSPKLLNFLNLHLQQR